MQKYKKIDKHRDTEAQSLIRIKNSCVTILIVLPDLQSGSIKYKDLQSAKIVVNCD